jgi:hydroxymethylbilane synthase
MAIIDTLRIGTRGSPLALRQTSQVIEILKTHHPTLSQPGAVETVVIKTTGDREQSQLLSEIGGKGLFTKEIDEAMLRDDIDLAIHSMKDMPTIMPEGIVLHSINERLDPRDAFISTKANKIMELPQGATVGTASLRRKAQLLNLRPDLRIVGFRGNIDTRLEKLSLGEADATLLAYAGLKRLGKESIITELVNTEHLLPAVGQGVLAATCKEGDRRTNMLITKLTHLPTAAAVLAERAMLKALDGSCQTPIAGLACLKDENTLTLRGNIVQPDGTQKTAVLLNGPINEAEQLGVRVAEKLILNADPAILESIKHIHSVVILPHEDDNKSPHCINNTQKEN